VNNLLTSIIAKTVGSDLSADVNGRIFFDYAPQKTVYPYVVFFIISAVPSKTFTEHYTDTSIQFSLFSSSESAAEITTIYADLKTLFDECSLIVTGSSLVRMKETNLSTIVENITTENGIQFVRVWHSDFSILTSLN